MSLYRRSVFFIKGLQEFTVKGYNNASKNFKPEDMDGVSCKGKSYMITGANSGIGKETALEIAKRGGTVHMVCRNAKYAEDAKNEIIEASQNQDVHVHILDMSEPKSIFKFAEEFKEKNSSLNCLVNNAGCMVNSRELTPEGLEKNFATNTVGTYIITEALMPLICKSEDPRVIVVSSGGMLTVKLDLSDLQSEKLSPFDGTVVYSQNKRQQVIFTQKLAKRYESVFFASMHPGWADTPALRSSMPDFHAKVKDKLRDTAQGADTIIWLAVSPAAPKQKSGLFFLDRQPVAEHLPLACTRSNDDDETRLMNVLDGYFKQYKEQ